MKNKQSKGLSLSANPKCLIKGTFSANTDVFASFFRKNDILKNSKLNSDSVTSPARGEVLKHLFFVIRRRRPANLDCRITSGNDNRVKSVTPVDDNRLGRWLRAVCNLINTPHSALSCHSLPQGAREYGRSMIEMLGVLAIIAVLSVGGIAGYSKAMEKFKITKAIGDYAILIQGLVEHLSDFRKLNAGGNVYGIAEPVQALGLVPDNWIIIQKRDEHQPTFSDAYGNYSSVFSRYNRVVFSIAIGGQNNTNGVTTTPAFSTKFCEEILTNVFAPLHSFIVFAGVWRSGNDNNDHTNSWYGDKYCGSEYRRCLTSITPIQINEVCKKCEGKTEQCSVTVEME